MKNRRAFFEDIRAGALFEAVDDGNLTPDQAKAFELMVKEWLATHWTDRECPRHEIMEAVCRFLIRNWVLVRALSRLRGLPER